MGYDARSCITAEELRRVGIDVPESIPGCAWVPRQAVRMRFAGLRVNQGTCSARVEVEIGAPFRWVAVQIDAEAGQ